jgi:hypothetical protein
VRVVTTSATSKTLNGGRRWATPSFQSKMCTTTSVWNVESLSGPPPPPQSTEPPYKSTAGWVRPPLCTPLEPTRLTAKSADPFSWAAEPGGSLWPLSRGAAASIGGYRLDWGVRSCVKVSTTLWGTSQPSESPATSDDRSDRLPSGRESLSFFIQINIVDRNT